MWALEEVIHAGLTYGYSYCRIRVNTRPLCSFSRTRTYLTNLICATWSPDLHSTRSLNEGFVRLSVLRTSVGITATKKFPLKPCVFDLGLGLRCLWQWAWRNGWGSSELVGSLQSPSKTLKSSQSCTQILWTYSDPFHMCMCQAKRCVLPKSLTR
jgi:hypothetical protein